MSQCYMHCGTIDNMLAPNKVLYRFNGALPNIGAGPLEIREVTHPDSTQDVYQRIYDTDGGMTEVLIGSFPGSFAYPPRHLYLPGIAQYNLRTVLPGNGVGDIVSSHDKISMAVVDSIQHSGSVPREYDDISAEILGISVGWADLYSRGLPGQWVDATGLSPGQYWLEVIADPHNRIQESNEVNNTTRILVDLPSIPNPINRPGDYNLDGEVDAADYVVWRDTLGTILPPNDPGIGADGDASNRIDAADYFVWRANFGTVVTGTGATSSAPEPTTLGLLLIALACHRVRSTNPHRGRTQHCSL